MKKWYDEEYEWEIGDKYICTYGCPVNSQGQGICSKVIMIIYPIMKAVRSGGDLLNVGGDSKYSKVVMCPDGCVLFRITAKPLGNENFLRGNFLTKFRFVERIKSIIPFEIPLHSQNL